MYVPRLFGTAGIRGRCNIEITPEFALRLGLAVSQFLGNEGKIIIGRDTRLCAEVIELAIISGVICGGVDVIEAGVAPTPSITWTIKDFDAKGAIMVTGSHLPPDRIGIMVIKEDGTYLFGRDVELLETIYFEKKRKEVPWNKVGKKIVSKEILKIYKKKLLNVIDKKNISKRAYRVVIDPGHGACCGILSEILSEVGCDCILINEEPDGNFPGRLPEPISENLEKTATMVKSVGADIGIATDSDGDRVRFISSEGVVISADVIGAFFVENEFMNKEIGPIVTPINSSSLIEWLCQKYHAKLVWCKIGPPDTVRAIKEEKAIFAYEEVGKYYFTDISLWTDACLSTLKLLETLAYLDKDLSEISRQYPTYYQIKTFVECPDDLKIPVLGKVKKLIDLNFLDLNIRQVFSIDGLKIVGDEGWLLIRPSGTEPIIRVYSESKKEERTKNLSIQGINLVKKAIELVQNKGP